MTTAEQMPPLPKTDWRLHMTASRHEPAWTSTEEGYTGAQTRAYARAYAAQEVARALAPLPRRQIEDVMTQHYPLESLLRESVDAFEACVRDIEAAIRARNA